MRGSAMLCLASSKEEVLERVKRDVYTQNGVWDVEKVSSFFFFFWILLLGFLPPKEDGVDAPTTVCCVYSFLFSEKKNFSYFLLLQTAPDLSVQKRHQKGPVAESIGGNLIGLQRKLEQSPDDRTCSAARLSRKGGRGYT